MAESFQGCSVIMQIIELSGGSRVCGFFFYSHVRRTRQTLGKSGSGHYWLINNFYSGLFSADTSNVFFSNDSTEVKLLENRNWLIHTRLSPKTAQHRLRNKLQIKGNCSETYHFDTAHFLYLTRLFENAVLCNSGLYAETLRKSIRAQD